MIKIINRFITVGFSVFEESRLDESSYVERSAFAKSKSRMEAYKVGHRAGNKSIGYRTAYRPYLQTVALVDPAELGQILTIVKP